MPTVEAVNGRVQTPPLSLYVHLPWCVKKCPYCDFNSHRAGRDIPQARYIDALVADVEQMLPDIWGRRIHSVFLGGGTPSLFAPAMMERLFSNLRALLPVPPDIEITLEANPGAADAGKFKEFCALGINRLSLGAQSFDDKSLARLGRIHDGAAARTAAAAARDIFPQVNLDLMHALPKQTPAMAAADVQTALSFSPNHLSLYQLTLEEGTPFYKTPPPHWPNDDTAAETATAATGTAATAGFARYEVSAFSRPGDECRHNLNYWRFGDYLGIGAGAHGKLCVNGEVSRHQRIKQPTEYMRRALQGDSIARRVRVDGQRRIFEFMLNTLRLTDGFSPPLFLERTGCALAAIEKPLQTAEARGLIRRDARNIAATELGLRHLNDLLLLFLPDENSGGKEIRGKIYPLAIADETAKIMDAAQ